jgi:hypothetical protein
MAAFVQKLTEEKASMHRLSSLLNYPVNGSFFSAIISLYFSINEARYSYRSFEAIYIHFYANYFYSRDVYALVQCF